MPTPEQLMQLQAMGGAPGGGPAGPRMGRGMMNNPWVQQLYQLAQRAQADRAARMQQFQASPMGQRLGAMFPQGGGGLPPAMPQGQGFAMGEPGPGMGPGIGMPPRAPTAAEGQARQLQAQPQGEERPGEQEPDNDPDDKAAPRGAMPSRDTAPAARQQVQPQGNRMPSFGASSSGAIQDEIRKRRAAGAMY